MATFIGASIGVVLAVAAGWVPVDSMSPADISHRPAATARERSHEVCRRRASLRNAPAGVVIGHLRRGDRAIVTLYARRHRWAHAMTAEGYGWLLTAALCRRGRG